MNFSSISFGKIGRNNNDYDFAKYYNLNNNNITPSVNDKKPQKDAFYSTNSAVAKKEKNTNGNKVKKVLSGTFFVFLSSLLGLNVLTSDNKNTEKSKQNVENQPTSSYSSSPTIETGAYKDSISISTQWGTKDYIIGDTRQGKTADCWLLATINSINLTKNGKEFFANMFEYKENETTVHLFVGDYTITDEELKNGKIRNSKGDDDVLLIELAVEKALADYNAGKVKLPEAVITEELGGKGTFSTLNMGSQDAAIYILTGNTAKYTPIHKNEEAIDNWFKMFETEQKGKMSLTASIETDDTCYTNPKTGETNFLRGHHGYTIKDIKDGYITITNPDNSSKEIKIDIESFKNIFSSVTYADISDIV